MYTHTLCRSSSQATKSLPETAFSPPGGQTIHRALLNLVSSYLNCHLEEVRLIMKVGTTDRDQFSDMQLCGSQVVVYMARLAEAFVVVATILQSINPPNAAMRPKIWRKAADAVRVDLGLLQNIGVDDYLSIPRDGGLTIS